MDAHSVSTRSRSSSIFSLDSCPSSITSAAPSPRPTFDEKHAYQQYPPQSPKPVVLHWKPQLFSTAFTHQVSTHISFTAFPPCDYQQHLTAFDTISRRNALALLQDPSDPLNLSIFAGPESTATPTLTIPIPSNLPSELFDILHDNPAWSMFIVSEPAPTLLSINSITATYKHYVAIRNLRDGVERYIFGPAGLSVHSVCRIIDTGRARGDVVPPETLYLQETTEVICNKATKWFYRSATANRTTEAHERLRICWDYAMQRDWSMVQQARDLNLLV